MLLGLTLGCVPLALGQPSASARHEHKKDYRHEIEDLEEKWRMATLDADVSAMEKLLSDDYVGISMAGQVSTKQQQLDRLRTRTLVLTQLELMDLKVKLVGPVAIVTGHAQIDGTNEGSSLKGEYRYTRVYQRLASGVWKITNFEVTRIPKPKPKAN